MAGCRLIVCEKTGRWAAALRRHLPQWERSLRETRSLSDCREELARSPSGLLVLEVSDANFDSVLSLLGALREQFPQAVAVAATGREFPSLEWMLREMGAAHVVTSTRSAGELVRIWMKHEQRQAESSPTSLDDVLEQLPWA